MISQLEQAASQLVHVHVGIVLHEVYLGQHCTRHQVHERELKHQLLCHINPLNVLLCSSPLSVAFCDFCDDKNAELKGITFFQQAMDMHKHECN